MTSRAESCPPKLVLTNTTLGKPNAALQGAAQAFSTRPAIVGAQPRNQTSPDNTAAAAAAATAAAGTKSLAKNGPPPRPIKQQDGHQPTSIKSPSRSAAQAASARVSPQKDVVPGKTYSKPIATDAFREPPKLAGDDVPKQKTEVEGEHGRGRPRLDNAIAVPQPVRPLPRSAALTAILGLEPEISPGNSPPSASPPARTSTHSADISAARAAARRAIPATQVPNRPSSVHVIETPRPSFRVPEPLPYSNTSVQPSPKKELSLPTSWVHKPTTQKGHTRSRSVPDAHTGVDHESERAASSAMKDTASVDESPNALLGRVSESAASPATTTRTISSGRGLQTASTSPPKNAIARDAIIAWSAASSRSVSPTKVILPPTLRRRSKSFGMFHQLKAPEHQPPRHQAPVHVMKHTLRKRHQPKEEDEENVIGRRGRRHFIRKHQHKHHEGDRKRWRDRITDKERKRYEGVWAANRGLFTFWDFSTTEFENSSPAPAEMDVVLNIVVREIWERSRLPKRELEEVWDLVAREDANALRRDEFVVGLWLLDQRLKGRKLPPRVSPSVWASVRHTLKIRAKP
jgi:hypothetical protein